MSAAVFLLQKDAALDAIGDVMVTCGDTWRPHSSLRLPGRLDRCWTWRCSASGAASAMRRVRSVLTSLPLHFWIGGRSSRLFADKTTMGYLVRWRWKE